MKKSLSRNPNMLRTMIGLGMTLILLLGYAVYSNTLDSEYYRFETTNEEVVLTTDELDDDGKWYVTTTSAISWLNITIENLPEGSEMTVSSSSIPFYTSESLGADNAGRMFTCKDINEDFELIVESCDLGFSHDLMESDGVIEFKSIVAIELPLGGVGYIEGEDYEDAFEKATERISEVEGITTWSVEVRESGEVVNLTEAPEIHVVTHELVGVEEFKLDPVTETLYGLASLIGCFTMMIVVPMIAYFSSVARQKKEDRLRAENPPPTD
ncbi:MAG: hypothetical protein VXY31_00525 [Candidatus Thermoplasmatota archaeon]|nr:hypothetical protein [Candidatus Thermoplasmatota archaeon]